MKRDRIFRILFTSVGRRVELMQAFRHAAEELGVLLQIYGADITEDAPALFYCDEKRKVCKIRERDYIPQLLALCRQEKIDILIPTIDTDLLILSQKKEDFLAQGTKVMISAEDKIALCRDKRYTADFYRSCGVASPHPVDRLEDYDGGFPAFIKPKDGSSSINAYRADTLEELQALVERVPDYIIQPFIDGREYTVDIFCDFDGNPVYITPRERLAVRSGEVLKTEIVQDERMIEESLQVVKGFQPCGAITLQLIREKETEDDYFIEINPRFGGGAPLSMLAGADSAKAVLLLLMGETMTYQEKAAKDGLIYSRFDQCICVNGEKQICRENEAVQQQKGQEEETRKEKNKEFPIIHTLTEADIYVRDLEAVILDLDDTLYNETDYVKSGYQKIAELYPEIPRAQEELWRYFMEGKPAIDLFLKNHSMEKDKEMCLLCYRSQMPDIALSKEYRELLIKWRREGKKLGIITDGRPQGQRNKIAVLGLESMVDEIIVTDELAGAGGDVRKFRKPAKIAFEMMQMRLDLPFESMVYIGDNKAKDFLAPEALGMQCLWIRNEKGLYR